MRIAAISYGTEGDIRPFLALARELHRAGHELVLAGDEGSAPLVEGHPLTFVPLGGGIRSRLSAGESGDDLARFVRRGRSTLAGLGVLRTLFQDHLHEWTVTFVGAVEQAGGADVVLASGLSLPAGFTAAELLDAPVVACFFQPFLPGRGQPSSVLPTGLPLALHEPLAIGGQQLGWWALAGQVNDSRRRLGLAPQRGVWRDYPSLCAWSPSLVPVPAGAGQHVTGNWALPAPAAAPDEELLAFLDDGPPPVYVGFGSMALPDGLLQAVVDGLDGRRALLAPGWSGAVPQHLPEGVRVVGHLPHSWLLPRCAAAVHHCGAGTSHAAARAGVVSVPVPIAVDQPFWASRLHAVGAATEPLAARRATAAQVSRALDRAPSHGLTAGLVGRQMAGQDGAHRAVEVLEDVAARGQ